MAGTKCQAIAIGFGVLYLAAACKQFGVFAGWLDHPKIPTLGRSALKNGFISVDLNLRLTFGGHLDARSFTFGTTQQSAHKFDRLAGF